MLRWDPYRKQHFYLEFSHDVQQPLSQDAQIIDEESVANGYTVAPGSAVELTIQVPKKEPPKTTTISMHQLYSAPSSPKKWYDPFWCVWREEDTSVSKRCNNNGIRYRPSGGEPNYKKLKIDTL